MVEKKKKRENRIKAYLLELALIAIMTFALIFFRDFLNANSNAIMALITFVYVVATVEICRANIKSVEASREQLEESKRQFAETQRLGVIPYFTVNVGDPVFDKTVQFPIFDLYHSIKQTAGSSKKSFINLGVSISNIGPGMACRLGVTWKSKDDQTIQPLKQATLCSNQSNIFNISISSDETSENEALEDELIFDYYDIVGNHYHQNLLLSMSKYPNNQYISLISSKMIEPALIS